MSDQQHNMSDQQQNTMAEQQVSDLPLDNSDLPVLDLKELETFQIIGTNWKKLPTEEEMKRLEYHRYGDHYVFGLNYNDEENIKIYAPDGLSEEEIDKYIEEAREKREQYLNDFRLKALIEKDEMKRKKNRLKRQRHRANRKERRKYTDE